MMNRSTGLTRQVALTLTVFACIAVASPAVAVLVTPYGPEHFVWEMRGTVDSATPSPNDPIDMDAGDTFLMRLGLEINQHIDFCVGGSCSTYGDIEWRGRLTALDFFVNDEHLFAAATDLFPNFFILSAGDDPSEPDYISLSLGTLSTSSSSQTWFPLQQGDRIYQADLDLLLTDYEGSMLPVHPHPWRQGGSTTPRTSNSSSLHILGPVGERPLNQALKRWEFNIDSFRPVPVPATFSLLLLALAVLRLRVR